MSSAFPIIIISSNDMDKIKPIKGNWHALQKQWLNQNPNSTIFRAEGGHFIHHEHPNLACKQVNKLVQIATQALKPDRQTEPKSKHQNQSTSPYTD